MEYSKFEFQLCIEKIKGFSVVGGDPIFHNGSPVK